jgi:hypothetical protein
VVGLGNESRHPAFAHVEYRAGRSGAAAARPYVRVNGNQARGDDPLGLIAPPVYFGALARVDVPRDGGMIKCPLPDHEDAFAS